MTPRDLPDVADLIIAGRDREAARLGVVGSLPALGAPMEPLAQLDQLMPALGAVVGAIDEDDLDRTTPCADFTVRGVLEHMAGGAAAFAAGYRGDEPHEFDMTNIIPEWQRAMGELAGAITAPGALDQQIAAPFGEVSGDTFARFVALDGLVHGWDLSQATGTAYSPSDDLVAAVDAFARGGAIDPLRDGQTFAAATEAPEGADAMTRLAAYTGRSV